MLQVEVAEEFEPVPEPTRAAPEWFWLVRAGVSRERVAMTVAVIAVSVAAFVIVVIPVITGRIG